jgi:ELWxxDGT repeat protein
MKLRAVVFGALVIAVTVAAPASAEQGIHVSPGAVDEHGCYALDVWNGDVLLKTIPAFDGDPSGCATLGATAFLPNGILLFDWQYPNWGGGLYPGSADLWASDGTTDGTVRIKSYGGYRESGAWEVVGRAGYLSVSYWDDGHEIVATRGTPASTWTLPGRLSERLQGPLYVVLHGRIFYSATHPTKGRELWVSNGTAASTHLVRDIRRGAHGSHPRSLSSDGTRLRFTANDGTGRRWWVSDGTRAGTHPE